nr:hypothetical protein [Kibdelosporangium sp. MJ126-NF4]
MRDRRRRVAKTDQDLVGIFDDVVDGETDDAADWLGVEQQQAGRRLCCAAARRRG